MKLGTIMVDGSFNLTKANTHKQMPRRRFLQLLTAGSVAALSFPEVASAGQSRKSFIPRELSFENLHTGEKASLTYFERGKYVQGALHEINNLFRDHRTDEIHPIDPNLLNILYRLRATLEVEDPFQIISGYRSQQSNEELRLHSNGVAKRSLHMEGKAVDIRIKNIDCKDLRDAAISLQQGGVGYYASSDFVHVDTGLVRVW